MHISEGVLSSLVLVALSLTLLENRFLKQLRFWWRHTSQ